MLILEILGGEINILKAILLPFYNSLIALAKPIFFKFLQSVFPDMYVPFISKFPRTPKHGM